MKISYPPFGFISGLFLTLGLLPYLIFLLLIVIMFPPLKSNGSMTALLVIFIVGAKVLGEWLYWSHCRQRMDREGALKNWRSVTDSSLLSDRNVFFSLFFIFLDNAIDGILLYTALKLPIAPVWIFFTFFGCQALASPIQGLASDCSSQRRSLLFSLTISFLVLILIFDATHVEEVQAFSFSLSQMFGISSFSPVKKMFIFLIIKGVLANTSVLARAAIASVVKIRTLEKS